MLSRPREVFIIEYMVESMQNYNIKEGVSNLQKPKMIVYSQKIDYSSFRLKTLSLEIFL